MTLRFTLAATPELRQDAEALIARLARQGIEAAFPDAEDPGASPADLLRRLREGGVDHVLTSAEAGRDLPGELTVSAVLPREEPRDVLIAARDADATLGSLEAGARIGVGNLRRRGFLLAHRPDVQAVAPGNGGGPIQALRSGSLDAIVLGNADARRLGLAPEISEVLDPKAWVPGAGQGTLILLGRAGEGSATRDWGAVGDPRARIAFLAESATLAAQGAEGDTPLGVLAMPYGSWIRVWGMAATSDGTRVVRGDVTGRADDPEGAGRALADLLFARGLAGILKGVGA